MYKPLENINRGISMKKIKTVVACVWMMCISLCVFAAQPTHSSGSYRQ